MRSAHAGQIPWLMTAPSGTGVSSGGHHAHRCTMSDIRRHWRNRVPHVQPRHEECVQAGDHDFPPRVRALSRGRGSFRRPFSQWRHAPSVTPYQWAASRWLHPRALRQRVSLAGVHVARRVVMGYIVRCGANPVKGEVMIGVFVQVAEPTRYYPRPRGYIVCESGCWEWVGRPATNGYARLHINGRHHYAHRFVYETAIGPIPEGRTLDHLCRNKMCVRPDHLEPVTDTENVLRGNGLGARNSRKTQCALGHPLTPSPFGFRWCQQCTSATRKRYAKLRWQRVLLARAKARNEVRP